MTPVDMGPAHHQPRYQLTPGERAKLAAHAARCGICLSSSGGHCTAYRDLEWMMERDGQESMRPTLEMPVLTSQQIDDAMMRAVRAHAGRRRSAGGATGHHRGGCDGEPAPGARWTVTHYVVVAKRNVWATALLLMTDAEYAQLRMRCLAEGRGIPAVIGAMCDAGGRSRDTEWREVR